jgi:hypothetical protein
MKRMPINVGTFYLREGRAEECIRVADLLSCWGTHQTNEQLYVVADGRGRSYQYPRQV